MSLGSPKREIIISVEESTDARVFSNESDIIQQDALDALKGLTAETVRRIGGFTKRLHESGGRWERPRHHDVIAIFGGRGTGKTTFILNALNTLSGRDSEILSLGIIDPTLVECRESIFLNIISRVRKKVDEQRRSQQLFDNGHSRYQMFDESLNRLAQGLAQLNGIGTKALSHDVWDDPHFIMQEGLFNVQQGEELESHFHQFLDDALKCLNMKAFIMAFDDIDTDFSRGWDVLEILRKYLTSPQLVVLLSGDFELYSNLIRMEQWKHFEADFLDKERDSSPHNELKRFRERVDSLEDQYLRKILKPERRIELKRLEQVVEQHRVGVALSHWPADKVTPLAAFTRSNLQAHYHLTSATGLESALSHIIKQPLRTVIQVLQSWAEVEVKRDMDGPPVSPFDLHEDMARIFATQLGHFGFRWPKDILAARTRFGMNVLAQRLQQNDLLQDGTALPATLGTDDRSSAALVMGGYYAAAILKQPSLAIDYFIKVLLTRDQVGTSSKNVQEAYFKAASLGVDEPSLITARKHAAYAQELVYPTGTRPVSRGYLRLSAEWIQRQEALERIRILWGLDSLDEEVLKHGTYDLTIVSAHMYDFLVKDILDQLHLRAGQYSGRYYNTVNSLSKYTTSWHKAIANLLLAGITVGGRKNAHFLSAYQLVALVGLMAESAPGELEATIKRNLDPTQLRKFQPEAYQESAILNDSGEDLDTSLGGKFEFETLSAFLEEVAVWKAKCSGISALPLEVYASIWIRFQRNLEKIEGELTELYVGFVLDRFAVAFLNAILVEEAWHKDATIRLNEDTPIDSEKVLIDNIKYVRDESQECPYFDWILACPLWSLLLKRNSETLKEHLKALELTEIPSYASVSYSGTSFYNLHPLLNSLVVPSHRESKKNTVLLNSEIAFDVSQKIKATQTHALKSVRSTLIRREKQSTKNEWNLPSDVRLAASNLLDKITPLQALPARILRTHYLRSKQWFKDEWDTVVKTLPQHAKNIDTLTRYARSQLFRLAKNSTGHKGSFVTTKSKNGQAYLRAFLEVLLEKNP